MYAGKSEFFCFHEKTTTFELRQISTSCKKFFQGFGGQAKCYKAQIDPSSCASVRIQQKGKINAFKCHFGPFPVV